MEKLSYASESSTSPWTTYLRQIDRVAPYLGDLAYWVETLRHPKRALIVDIPVQMDDSTIRHFEGYRVQHNLSRGRGKMVFATIRMSILTKSWHFLPG